MSSPSSQILNLEETLKLTLDKMLEYEQRGEYVEAQRCRVEIQHRKQQLKNYQLYEIQSTHKRQRNEMNNQLNNELSRINQFWTSKMNEFKSNSENNIKQMNNRHHEECIKHQQDLQAQLSTKVKESSELLNLKKMEQQMAKQKNYVEAHLVQQKIKKMYVHQSEVWMQKRKDKINQALINLKNKQNAELNNLTQRITTTEQDNTKDHHFQVLLIKQKYQNSLRDLRAHQQRQVLSFKGEFRTLGGGSPTSSPLGKSKASTIRV